MANSEAQNVQRGIIMLWFLNTLLMFIFVAIRLVKKEIDPVDQENAKYAENANNADAPKIEEPEKQLPQPRADSH